MKYTQSTQMPWATAEYHAAAETTPCTRARLERITPKIIDAKIVAANQAAALWFGENSPTQLYGDWLSRRIHQDDEPALRILAVASHEGYLEVPLHFRCRIQLPDHSVRPTFMRTESWSDASGWYWETAWLPPAGGHTVHEVLRGLHLPETVHRLAEQWYSIADIEALLLHEPPMKKHLRVDKQLPSIVGQIHTESRTIPRTPMQELVLWPGVTITLPSVAHRKVPTPYLHWCRQCHELFFTRSLTPKSCTKKTCLSSRWSALQETLTPEERACTVRLHPGETVTLPPGTRRAKPKPYLHWCARCLEVFQSQYAEPVYCGKCANKYWRGDYVRDVRRSAPRLLESAVSK